MKKGTKKIAMSVAAKVLAGVLAFFLFFGSIASVLFYIL